MARIAEKFDVVELLMNKYDCCIDDPAQVYTCGNFAINFMHHKLTAK